MKKQEERLHIFLNAIKNEMRLFKKCCDVKGIKESQSAFCLYRDF